MRIELIHACPELIDYINETGFLPLLSMGIAGWSAEEVVDEDCQYTRLPDGGWEWPLWEWKGSILQESGCAYGKFFSRKAAFISREWWPDFCNYRRSIYPYPEEGSIEEAILATLKSEGQPDYARAACGMRFHGTENAQPFRCLPHPAGDGRLHRNGGFHLSPRPTRKGVWLGMVSAHHARTSFWQGCLPPRPQSAGVPRTVARPAPENSAGGIRESV